MDNKANVTSKIETKNISTFISGFVSLVSMQRKGFERRWYDNNFFDDGYHFRYISRTTGRIIDQNNRNSSMGPIRAIPKASRQLRGLANLLLAPEFRPVVYPKKIAKANYPDPKEYMAAKEMAKQVAQKKGNWITKEWDKQELKTKLTQQILLAGKNSVGWIEIWPDAVEEKIKTKVYDAFDISVLGMLDDSEDSPMIVKSVPKLISEIKANENFDKEQLKSISPDNKYASSEIKEAYLRSRYGSGVQSDSAATLIQHEAFIKEYLDTDNAIKVATDLGESAKELKRGDLVIRQVFVAGDVWLYDKYTTLKSYPLVPFTFEPGPLYQVPQIERFIPANKSLDIIMSRIESFSNTMGVGVYMRRKGENFQISNKQGAQIIEYEGAKPEQMNLAGMPESIFRFAEMLEKNIEEQGAATSALNQLPSGVKSGVAIESVKATEYANLKIASDQLKKTVTRITEKMCEIAENYFYTPQTVELLEKGEPSYFDIIGSKGLEARNKLGMELPQDIIPIDSETQVDIEVEQGMGFTEQGRRDTMQQIITFFTPLIQAGSITSDTLKIITQNLLDTYSFGATQDLMDSFDSGTSTAPITEDQIQQIKVAVLETLKDAAVVGPQADQKLVDSTKLGTLETLKESGMIDKLNPPIQDNPETAPIPYKDAPEDIKRQMEAQAGFTPSKGVSPAGTEQITKVVSASQPKQVDKKTEAK